MRDVRVRVKRREAIEGDHQGYGWSLEIPLDSLTSMGDGETGDLNDMLRFWKKVAMS